MEFPTILGFHLEKQWDPVFLLLSTFLTSLNSSSKIFLASMVALDFPNIKTCLPHKLSGTEFICQACSKYNSSRRCGSASSALQYLNTLLVQADTTERQTASRQLPPGQIPPGQLPPGQVPPGQAPEQIYEKCTYIPQLEGFCAPFGRRVGERQVPGKTTSPQTTSWGGQLPPGQSPGGRGLSRQFLVQISAQNLSQILNV